MLRFLILFFLTFLSLPVMGAPHLARIFSDHAVLQQGVEIGVWGGGIRDGSNLLVKLGNVEVTAEGKPDGNWSAVFPPRTANAEGTRLVLIEDGVEVDSASDILIGEVWLAAGQSNMQFQVKGMLKGMPSTKAWVDSTNHSSIRFRRIDDPVLSDREREAADLAAENDWVPMTSQSVLSFSAVAASFATSLSEELKVPIGIIDVSWGGKPIEPFLPREAFSTPLLSQIKSLADADKLEELASLKGGVIIRNPEGHPGAIFNARIAPLILFGLKGFLWYQAESNAGRGEDPREYRYKMEALAKGWRSRWKHDELPFYFVQLPSYPPATGWIRMREEQRRALENIPRSGMAVTIDIRGDDIHPPDKRPVGDRLAGIALSQSYGRESVAPSGPIYREHEIKGNAIHVSFDHSESGLMIGDRPDSSPVVETPNSELNWFELADAEENWHPAKATISGETVIVSSESVDTPAAVRYACDTKPQGGNLYNRAGLPASPFCSKLDWLPWEDAP